MFVTFIAQKSAGFIWRRSSLFVSRLCSTLVSALLLSFLCLRLFLVLVLAFVYFCLVSVSRRLLASTTFILILQNRIKFENQIMV